MELDMHTQANNDKFTISGVIGGAWHKLKGSKGIIWGTAALMLLIAIGFGIVGGIFSGIAAYLHNHALVFIADIIQLLLNGAMAVFFIGVLIVAINKARQQAVTVHSAFMHLKRFWATYFTWIVLMLIAMLIYAFGIAGYAFGLWASGNFEVIAQALANKSFVGVQIGSGFFVFSGLYFLGFIAVMYFIMSFLRFSLPLVYDKQLSTFNAIGRSVKMAAPHWFRNFILTFVVNFIVAIIIIAPVLITGLMHSGLLLFVGIVASILIVVWALPYVFLLYGEAYQQLDKLYEKRHAMIESRDDE
ncbi:MAG: hypothetical protein K0U12_02665 [Gammaproteobacteria bacterium]|nr:hypothetical protein [Gammaproteobacteria bacterium]